MIIFGLVWFLSKIITKPVFKKKTKTKPKPIQTDRFRFGYFRKKTGFFYLARFFLVWLSFSDLARFFLVFFGLGSVRFGFFRFRLIKPNRTYQIENQTQCHRTLIQHHAISSLERRGGATSFLTLPTKKSFLILSGHMIRWQETMVTVKKRSFTSVC